MEQTLGARLRAQREQRGISLEEISKETKIKMTMLERLEHDDVTYWPPGLFRRAYLRSYAGMIGADPEAVVREFLELYPDPSEQALEEQPQPTGLRRAMALLKARTSRSTATARALPPPAPAQMSELPELAPEEDGFSSVAVHPAPVSGNLPEAVLTDLPEPVFETWPGSGVAEAAEVAPEPQSAGGTSIGIFASTSASWLRRDEPSHLDLVAFSDICARIARLSDWDEMTPLLGEAADMWNAVGVTVWSWDGRLGVLVATWAHGYSYDIVTRMPRVRRDADNALADAWRDERLCIVASDSHATGAIVVPIMTSCGCIGVLAVELGGGREHDPTIRSLATILAAQLALLLGAAPLAEAATA